MEGDYVIVYYIINNLLLHQITETYELLLFKPRTGRTKGKILFVAG